MLIQSTTADGITTVTAAKDGQLFPLAVDDGKSGIIVVWEDYRTGEDWLIFLKSTQKSVSINGLSIRGYENAKKCQLICPQYVKNIPYFQYKIE